jgi:hypothetical protein
MILRTRIEWLQLKKLSANELAKREVLGSDYDSSDEYETVEKEAIVDTINDKLYIELTPEKICMTRLLNAEYAYNENGQIERIEERVTIMETLDNIYNKLQQEQSIKN